MSAPIETRTNAGTLLVGVAIVVSMAVVVGLVVLAVKNPATGVLAGFAVALVLLSFAQESRA